MQKGAAGRALVMSLALAACGMVADAQDTRSNILLIVTDDLANSDFGSYSAEIRTPVCDQLAQEGLRFSNFYVLPTCSSTLSALMSGNTNHSGGMKTLRNK